MHDSIRLYLLVLLLPTTAGATDPTPALPVFDETRHQAAATLIEREAGADSAQIYRQLAPAERLSFLSEFWSRRNPFVYDTVYRIFHTGLRPDVAWNWQDGYRLTPPPFRSPADAHLDSSLITEACRIVSTLLSLAPKDPMTRIALGYLKLEAGNAGEAKLHFQQVPRSRRYPEAANGLGLSAHLSGDLETALELFRIARTMDDTYIGPHANEARALLSVDLDLAAAEFDSLAFRDPLAPDLNFKRGCFSERQGRFGVAAALFAKELEINPGHPGARKRLSRAQLVIRRSGGYPMLWSEVTARAAAQPVEYGPLLAEYHIQAGHLDAANKLIAAYLDALPPEERDYYEDIGTLLSPASARIWYEAPRIQRNLMRRGYWIGNDPTPTTEMHERRIEHNRRVHFARTVFSDGQTPWDERGDAYVRFGHPHLRVINSNQPDEVRRDALRIREAGEHIAQSDDRAWKELQDIRDRLADPPNYPVERGADWEDWVYLGWKQLQDIRVRLAAPPNYPVERGADWEAWVYADVDGGVELTFEDRDHSGVFRLADIPEHTRAREMWEARSPRRQFDAIVTRTPTQHSDPVASRLRFHYVNYQFAGPGDSTQVDLCVSVPLESLQVGKATNLPSGSRRSVRGSLTLEALVYDSRWELIRRIPVNLWNSGRQIGGRLIGRKSLNLLPGRYFQVIEVRSSAIGDFQFYRAFLDVVDHSRDELSVSSVVLAREVEPITERFSDSVRVFAQKDFYVFPEPVQIYEMGDRVSLYYEIYGLQRDQFGQTHFTVEYTVRGTHELEVQGAGQRDSGGEWQGRTGSSIRPSYQHLLQRSDSEDVVTLSYEHTGYASTESVYIGLDGLRQTKPDVMKATVRVIDRNATGSTPVERSVGFGLTQPGL